MTSGASEPKASVVRPGEGRPEILTPRARALLPLFLVALIVLAVHRLWIAAPPRAVLRGEAMGTTWSVTLDASGRSREDLDRAREAIEAELAQVSRLMSTWDADSELSQFNRHASLDPFPLSRETLQVLRVARAVSDRTGGAFDVTVGPLVAAWGFGAGARAPGPGPEPAELAALRRRVGYALVELDPAAGTARKQRPDVECDLSAIAKGFGVDRVALTLQGLGWGDWFVEVGGEVRARGARPEGGAWRVGIERPDESGRAVHAALELAAGALATSGDYRSFYVEDGERRSHVIDPRTGRPVTHALASVSVLHADAVHADAWATALTVLGPDEGFAIAEAEALAAYFIVRAEGGAFETRATSAFPALASAPAP